MVSVAECRLEDTTSALRQRDHRGRRARADDDRWRGDLRLRAVGRDDTSPRAALGTRVGGVGPDAEGEAADDLAEVDRAVGAVDPVLVLDPEPEVASSSGRPRQAPTRRTGQRAEEVGVAVTGVEVTQEGPHLVLATRDEDGSPPGGRLDAEHREVPGAQVDADGEARTLPRSQVEPVHGGQVSVGRSGTTTTSIPLSENTFSEAGVAVPSVTRVHWSGMRAHAWNGASPIFEPCART